MSCTVLRASFNDEALSPMLSSVQRSRLKSASSSGRIPRVSSSQVRRQLIIRPKSFPTHDASEIGRYELGLDGDIPPLKWE